MIKLYHIQKEYKKGKKSIRVIKDFSYDFHEGKIYLIKGSSGKGKTTLLSMIGLLDECDDGEIYFDTVRVDKLKNKERSKIVNETIGFMFQQYNLMEGLNVLENVLIHFLNEKKPDSGENVQRALSILEKVGLLDRKDHYPRELSGGEQQRVIFARALIKNPQITILDEPISNLDEDSANEIINIIKKYSEESNCITLIACHTNQFDQIADEIIKL